MTREELIRLAVEAKLVCHWDGGCASAWVEGHDLTPYLEHFAALVAAAEREKVARWMMERGYATGHGDTTEDLLQELDWQIAENWNRALINGITTEREACAKVCDDWPNGRDDVYSIGVAIRARGEAK